MNLTALINYNNIQQTIKAMTQIESIQMNIHHAKVELSKARRVICSDEIQQLHVNAAIGFYINELKELNFSLNCAIKQLSK